MIVNTETHLNHGALDGLLSICRASAQTLDAERYELTLRVVDRCDRMAEVMNLSDATRVQLSLAAWMHRSGELCLEQLPSLGTSPLLGNDAWLSYVDYTLLSALPLSEVPQQALFDIVTYHRHAALAKCRDGGRVPLAARVLCVATEFEELMFHCRYEAQQRHAIEQQFNDNAKQRYDDDAVAALLLSIAEQQVRH